MDIKKIWDRVPEYTGFLTVDEMDQRTLNLAEKYPDVVSVNEIGRSRWNHPIFALTIGHGSQNALVFGCPHPNEPIGAMMLDFFTEELASNRELREELDYTWTIVKTSDPDGTMLNEGWFKGPFTVTHYMRNFFRPAFHQQVEWSFPVDYKTLHFHDPIPETQALMRIIDEKKPTFIYSLHNSGFGGCYWYVTQGDEELYQRLYEAPAQEKIPLSLGEPEMPYCVEFYPAVYQMLGVSANYDYLEKFVPGQDPAALITAGTSSDEYANRDGSVRSRALINELPYFFDPRVDDTSPSDRTRLSCLLESCDEAERSAAVLAKLYSRAKPFVTTWNPFMIAVADRVASEGNLDAKREWAKNTPEFQAAATVSQKFDSLLLARFYQNLNIALMYRACCYEQENNKTLTTQDAASLQQIQQDADEYLTRGCAFLEEHLDYSVIPIQKLVKIQLASGLIYAGYAHKKASD